MFILLNWLYILSLTLLDKQSILADRPEKIDIFWDQKYLIFEIVYFINIDEV